MKKKKQAEAPIDADIVTTYQVELRAKRGKKWKWDGGTWNDAPSAAQAVKQYNGHGQKARLVEVFSTSRIIFAKERAEILKAWRKGTK